VPCRGSSSNAVVCVSGLHTPPWPGSPKQPAGGHPTLAGATSVRRAARPS
jgi:hypothetical protein